MPGDSGYGEPSQENLIHWVRSTGESEFVDAKGPMIWDGKEASASLAKDIVSFANSRDGGVIVIGKSEIEGGTYSYDGVTDEQAESFDTTRVMQWINARFAPPISAVCHCVECDGGRFIVIVVREFSDVPSICTRDYALPGDARKPLLRAGSIYVRSQNAASKPLSSVDELRALVGLATRKRADDLMSHIQAMLKGRSLMDLGKVPVPFDDEVKVVRSDLDLGDQSSGWFMSFHPVTFKGERWSSDRYLEELVAEHAVRIQDTFPGYRKGTTSMGWGIQNDFYGEKWALTRTGLFCLAKEFRENGEKAPRSGYRAASDLVLPIMEGEWLEFTWAARSVVDFIAFLSRFVDVFAPDEDIEVKIDARDIRGRMLVAISSDYVIGYGLPGPCRASSFVFKKTVQATSLRTDWKTICVEAIMRLYELFPGHMIDGHAVASLIERLSER